jgi:type I restriction enzyme, S subunit
MNQLGKPHGALGVSDYDGIISPAYFVANIATSVEPRFVHHLLRTRLYISEYERRGKYMPPSQFDISWEDFRGIPVVMPPLATQRSIADYLDRETARIDALIAAKRRMVGLLEERWVATVTYTTAPRWATDRILKGVYREVSDGWSIRKLGSLTRPEASIAYGILLPGERLAEGVPYLGAGDVRPDRLRLELLPRTRPEIAAAYPRTVMRSGELVYAIRGSFGAVEQLPPGMDGVNLSRDAARISPGEGINARWLMYALKSELAQEQFRRREVGATVTGVNIEDLKSVRLAVPPLEGQANQAAHLDGLRGNFDATDLALNRQLDLLVEHRQALITQAVTGQLGIPEAS